MISVSFLSNNYNYNRTITLIQIIYIHNYSVFFEHGGRPKRVWPSVGEETRNENNLVRERFKIQLTVLIVVTQTTLLLPGYKISIMLIL